MLDKLKALYAKYVAFGFTRKDFVRVVYAAAFTFIATFGPLATGLANFKNFQEVKAAALALIPAAIAAALSAAKNAFLRDGTLVKG